MKKLFIAVAALIVIITLYMVTRPQALSPLEEILANSTYAQELNTLHTQGEDIEIVQNIFSIQDPKTAAEAITWLRYMILEKEETNHIYPYAYAIMLKKTNYFGGNPDIQANALAMRAYAILLQQGDAKRCDDHGVGTNELVGMLQGSRAIQQDAENLEKAYKDQAKEIVIALEKKARKRAPRKEACYSGIKHMGRAMESESTQREERIAKEGNAEGHMTGSTLITLTPSTDMTVDFISDEEWHKRLNILTARIDELIY